MAQLDGCSDIYLHNNGFLLYTAPSGLLWSIRPLWGLQWGYELKCSLHYRAKTHQSNTCYNYFTGSQKKEKKKNFEQQHFINHYFVSVSGCILPCRVRKRTEQNSLPTKSTASQRYVQRRRPNRPKAAFTPSPTLQRIPAAFCSLTYLTVQNPMCDAEFCWGQIAKTHDWQP